MTHHDEENRFQNAELPTVSHRECDHTANLNAYVRKGQEGKHVCKLVGADERRTQTEINFTYAHEIAVNRARWDKVLIGIVLATADHRAVSHYTHD